MPTLSRWSCVHVCDRASEAKRFPGQSQHQRLPPKLRPIYLSLFRMSNSRSSRRRWLSLGPLEVINTPLPPNTDPPDGKAEHCPAMQSGLTALSATEMAKRRQSVTSSADIWFYLSLSVLMGHSEEAVVGSALHVYNKSLDINRLHWDTEDICSVPHDSLAFFPAKPGLIPSPPLQLKLQLKTVKQPWQ